MNKIVCVLSFCLLVAGCATPYQPVGLTGGYSETRLQEDVFIVHFRGNGHTSLDRCSDFALLRCADLTLQNKFKYFVIADSSQGITTSYLDTGGYSHTNDTINTQDGTSSGSFNAFDSGSVVIQIQKPRNSYLIRCFKEKPEVNAVVFDAEFLSKSIRDKYKMNTTEDNQSKPVSIENKSIGNQ